MLKIHLDTRVHKFLRKLPSKHERQVLEKILSLAKHPVQSDVQVLHGYAPLRRADIGEYRIVFSIDDEWIRIPLIGKRNDSDVYKRLDRLFG